MLECPYLENSSDIRICNASSTCMMLNEHDIARYCRGNNHDDCPLLLSYTLRTGSDRTIKRYSMVFSSFLTTIIIVIIAGLVKVMQPT